MSLAGSWRRKTGEMKVVIGSTTAIATDPAGQAVCEPRPEQSDDLKQDLRRLLAQILVADFRADLAQEQAITDPRVVSPRARNPSQPAGQEEKG